MGPMLLAEVERQLIDDLRAYGLNESNLEIDWSDACNEGHCTSALDGNLEGLSSVCVKGANGENVAEGWIDFIHGGDPNSLFVFWLFLSAKSGNVWQHIKEDRGLPQHIRSKLPEASKKRCANEGSYDSRWSKDPLVQAWKAESAV